MYMHMCMLLCGCEQRHGIPKHAPDHNMVITHDHEGMRSLARTASATVPSRLATLKVIYKIEDCAVFKIITDGHVNTLSERSVNSSSERSETSH